MRLLGVDFAPVWIPLGRRLQTFAVTFWICTFIFLGLGATLLMAYWLLCTRLWPLTVAYVGWFVYDRDVCHRGGRRWMFVRRWRLWRWFRDYFPIRIVKTCELDPDKHYIVGSHPHGVLSAGAFCNFCTEANDFSALFPDIKPYMLTLEGNYSEPFYREFFMTSGGVAASSRSMQYLLTQPGGGNMLILVVGGAPEALLARPGMAQLYFSKRKGFIKIALRTGTSLVPVFHFGENEIYSQVSNPPGSWLRRAQETFMYYMGLAPVLFLGRGILQYTFGIIPFRKPITTVVGEPIPVERAPNPTQQQIDQLHSRYQAALQQLYNAHRHEYAPDPAVDIEFL